MQYYCGGSSKPFKLNFLLFLFVNIILNALTEKFIMGDKLYQDCVSVDFLKFVLQLFEADKLDCKKVHHERTKANYSS